MANKIIKEKEEAISRKDILDKVEKCMSAYEANVGHDVVEWQLDGVGEQGTDELCTSGNFIHVFRVCCLSATFYDQMFL